MEPITPFIDRVRQIFDDFGVSTIIVAGSSGAYFNVADRVIQMDKYLPKDITDTAKKEAAAFQRPFGSAVPISKPCFDRRPRTSAEFRQGERIKLKSLGRDGVAVNRETVELRYVEQLADGEQSTALGFCIVYAQRRLFNGEKDLRRIVDQLETLMGDSLEKLTDGFRAEPVARPRRQEIFACFNRYRNLNLR